MAVRLADALRRGALIGAHAGGPDLLRIDWFERAHLPVDEVRAELGVVPKSELAIEAGSVGPWEAGGISPYQYEAGQRKAEAEGRDYDSYGADAGSARRQLCLELAEELGVREVERGRRARHQRLLQIDGDELLGMERLGAAVLSHCTDVVRRDHLRGTWSCR